MKMLKKFSGMFMAIALLVSCFSTVALASDGRISFTDPSTTVGAKVEVKCVLRSSGSAIGENEVILKYDSSYLHFTDGENVAKTGEGELTCSSDGGSAEVSYVINFQAAEEGSTTVTIEDASVSSTDGAALTFDEGSSAVTIGAGDPSLVEDEAAATSVSNAEDLQVEVNGQTYYLTDDFENASIPYGYNRTEVELNGATRQMVENGTSGVILGFLVDAEDAGDYFLFNEENASFSNYEEINISDDMSIVLLSDTDEVSLPSKYLEATLTIDEKEFPVWQDAENENYYLLYAINSNGETGFYQYDTEEGTYQRIEPEVDIEEEVTSDDSFLGKVKDFVSNNFFVTLVILGILAFIILIIILTTAIKLRRRNIELDDLYDRFGIDLDDEDEELNVKKSKKEKKADKKAAKKAAKADKKAAKKAKKNVIEDDFDDEDDFDVYDEDDYDDYDEADDSYDFDDEDDFEELDDTTDFDDFEEFDEDEESEDFDVFSDENLGKYNTKNFQGEISVGTLGDDTKDLAEVDELDDLLNDLGGGKASVDDDDDPFEMDFIDLD